jgi:hypothetical protein
MVNSEQRIKYQDLSSSTLSIPPFVILSTLHMARVATDATGAAPLTGDENDPKMQMTILPGVFGQQGKI